jgi:hypothetical protein
MWLGILYQGVPKIASIMLSINAAEEYTGESVVAPKEKRRLTLNTIPNEREDSSRSDIVVASPHPKHTASNAGISDLIDCTDSRGKVDGYRGNEL